MKNFGKGGQENDRIEIKVCTTQDPNRLRNNAQMTTFVDGRPPTMILFLWDETGEKDRSSAFDFTIITHEHHHGVLNRLIGGSNSVQCLKTAEAKGLKPTHNTATIQNRIREKIKLHEKIRRTDTQQYIRIHVHTGIQYMYIYRYIRYIIIYIYI